MIGGKGSIGSRYVAILKYLGHEAIVYDDPSEKEPFPEDWDKAIIATPTDTHYRWCKSLIETGKQFLCEKPLSKNIQECEELVSLDVKHLGRVVNNYRQVMRGPLENYKGKVRYNYYKTGSDGLYWDCCQLVYIDPDVQIKTVSPVFKLIVDDSPVTYQDIENGYVKMLAGFCEMEPLTEHWNLWNGMEMTKAVLERIERENRASDSSKN